MENAVMNFIKQSTLEQYEDLLQAGGAAYDRIASLFDAGTFVELGRFVKKSSTEFDDAPGNEFEGVVTGYGAVDGKLVFSFVQDFTRMKGAMSEAHAKKIVSLYDAALKAGAPVIGVYDSAGAKVLEGVSVLTAYGSVMKACASASGVIPQIAIVAGPCTGSMAACAEMADVVIAAEDVGKFYVVPPVSLRAQGQKDAGSVSLAASNGAVSVCVKNVPDALNCARKLVSLFPSNNAEGTAYTENADTANRLLPEALSLSEISAEILDKGSAVELFSAYAPDSATIVGSISGITAGIVAVGGKLTAGGAEKVSKFVSFCDSFNIPVVTLVDCEGTSIDKDSENAPFASKLAKLAAVYGSSVNAKVTVITGRAYGSVFTVLGSKTLGADVVYALPCARISVMPVEAAVEFIYSEQIKASDDQVAEKAAVTAEWDRICSPINAARNGDIDDVIDPTEIRMRIAASLEMLSGKATTAPLKKHGNLPL